MAILVADVGGTNSRLALAGPGGRLISQPQRFRNDDHADFLSVARAFRAAEPGARLTGACIAIAGPVSGETARLTNRDWQFDRAQIGAGLDLRGATGGAGGVRLINDIVALGYCLGALQKGQSVPLRAGRARPRGQRLVMGMGTGTNICAVQDVAGRVAVLEAELGHARLPIDVIAPLGEAIGDETRRFGSIEALFSGRGLVALHVARGGPAGLSAHEIVQDAQADRASDAAATLDLMAYLTGCLTQELFYYYMPTGGIYFAGSVARSVLSGAGRDRFAAGLARQGALADRLDMAPVHLILEDTAALAGCAHASTELDP
ncbi:MAG: glucokinase [Marinibacterium sp.]|nr:glucokinase [Marinibacterium sp.]